MASVLSRIFKRKGSKGRKAVTRAHFSQKKQLKEAVEMCDGLSLLKKRAPRQVPKNDKEKIKLFKKWCAEMGIEYHPRVSVQVGVGWFGW